MIKSMLNNSVSHHIKQIGRLYNCSEQKESFVHSTLKKITLKYWINTIARHNAVIDKRECSYLY
uniref:Uncharacterized protein n=1 Tax=Octopus bimaculoides TaxID=37653 RepID=A0A0L8HJY7_OCTBM